MLSLEAFDDYFRIIALAWAESFDLTGVDNNEDLGRLGIFRALDLLLELLVVSTWSTLTAILCLDPDLRVSRISVRRLSSLCINASSIYFIAKVYSSVFSLDFLLTWVLKECPFTGCWIGCSFWMYPQRCGLVT